MENVRGFFYDRYSVEASDFTALVGRDHDSMSHSFQTITGRPIRFNHFGWVSKTLENKALMVVVYKPLTNPLNEAFGTAAHEYFHVLQGTLSKESGYESPSLSAPKWLVEGTAVYAADHVYTRDEESTERFLRYVAELNLERPSDSLGDLRHIDALWGDEHDKDRNYVYAVGFAAAQYLGDPAYLDIWKAMGQGMGWREALLHVSGLSFDEFNQAFMEWLPSHIPELARVAVEVRWPEMGSPALEERDHLTIGISWEPYRPHPSRTFHNRLGETNLAKDLLIEMPGNGYVCLMWRSAEEGLGPKRVIGWYSNGELVSSREDAELIEFTGESMALKEWSLPGHPDTLQPQSWHSCY